MRSEKKSMVAGIRDRFKESGFVVLADCRGLASESVNTLRMRLRGKHSRMTVVKNAMLAIAAGEAGLEGIEAFMDGPTAMITGTGEVTDIAKVLQDFVKEFGKPHLKGGFLDGRALKAGDVEALASIPPREVLYAKIAGLLAAPMSGLAGVLNRKLSTLLYVLKAIEEKKSKQA